IFEVSKIQVDFKDNPMGIAISQVKFGWKLESSALDLRQQAYQIIVSTSEDFDQNPVWDSGRIESDKSRLVAYNGDPLESSTTYYWKVKVWGSDTKVSDWSTVGQFYTAPEKEELKGKWIGAISRADSHLPKGREMHTATFKKSKRDSIISSADPLALRGIMLRKEFKAEKQIQSAKVYIS